MGLSPQRPPVRAYEQNPEQVRRWKEGDLEFVKGTERLLNLFFLPSYSPELSPDE